MEQISIDYKYKKWLLLLLIPMSLLFNQANVVFGLNISLSDLFLFTISILFFYKRWMKIPLIFLIGALILSISVICTAIFWDAVHFQVNITLNEILRDYIKLLAVFLYFLLGYNLFRMDLLDITLKWFSIGAFCLGLVSILYIFTPISILHEVLFFGGNRFRGFMNDPNYFAVTQSAALMYFLSHFPVKKSNRIIIIAVLIFSILASGSKTGVILLGTLLLYRGIHKIGSSRIDLKKGIQLTAMLLVITVIIPIIFWSFSSILEKLSTMIPGFQRITELFTDFDGAISDSGSTRDIAWGNAIKLIQLSPIAGIGIGGYSKITMFLFGSPTIAHNTYLQLAVEWGLILATISIGYLIFLMIVTAYDFSEKRELIQKVRFMLLAFLIGSFALSLNNARLLWVLVGALVCCFYQSNKNKFEKYVK